jgi:hypothetical protein
MENARPYHENSRGVSVRRGHRGIAAPLLKYVGYAIVLAALGGAGYLFLPSLLSKILDNVKSKPTETAPAANSGVSGHLLPSS